jgi:peptidyl-prolyl cis-trans isomerase D
MIKLLQSGGKATKYFLGGLLFVISASMVTYLIPGFMADSTASTPSTVASVAGHNIQMTEVQTLAQRRVEGMMRQGYPDFYRQMLVKQSIPAAINELMQQAEVRYEADRLGLKVSDQELQDAMRTGPDGPYFFPEGKWIGQEKYEQLIKGANMSVEFYEQSLRQGLLTEKLSTAITAGVNITPAELQKAYKDQNTKIKFDYAVLSSTDLEKQVKFTDAELKGYFDAHKAQYQNSNPEKRQVRYFVFDRKQADANSTFTTSDLQKYYSEHQDQFRTQERIRVRHIWIKTPIAGDDGKVDEKALAAAKNKAADLLKQLKNGADFAELAKKNSEDTTAAAGGELGWIVKGDKGIQPEFESAAFAMSKGQMSDLVQTSVGIHIIQVEDKEDSHLKPYGDVKDEVEKAVKTRKAGEWLGQMVQTYQGEARATSLDKAAAKAGLQVVVSNPLARTDSLSGVGPVPEFMQAVFSTNTNSGPQAARFGDGAAIFQLVKIDPPKPPELDAVKDRVVKDFKAEQARHQLETKLKEMADRAHAQHDLRKAAKEVGATVKTSNFLAPKDQLEDIGSMGQAREAYNLKPGEISGPINLGGKGVVISLTERQEPSAEEAAKGSDEIREPLIAQKRQEAWRIYLGDLGTRLEKAGKVKFNKSAMDSLAKESE